MKRFGFVKSRRWFWSSCKPSLNPEQCKHRRTRGPGDQRTSLRFLSVGGSRWLQQTLTSRVTAARKFTSLRQSVKGGNPTLITVSRTELRSTGCSTDPHGIEPVTFLWKTRVACLTNVSCPTARTPFVIRRLESWGLKRFARNDAKCIETGQKFEMILLFYGECVCSNKEDIWKM